MPEKIDYRKQTSCPACGREISLGHLLCWQCFKYDRTDGKTPFKYWQDPESLWTDETAMVDAWIAYANAKA